MRNGVCLDLQIQSPEQNLFFFAFAKLFRKLTVQAIAARDEAGKNLIVEGKRGHGRS